MTAAAPHGLALADALRKRGVLTIRSVESGVSARLDMPCGHHVEVQAGGLARALRLLAELVGAEASG